MLRAGIAVGAKIAAHARLDGCAGPDKTSDAVAHGPGLAGLIERGGDLDACSDGALGGVGQGCGQQDRPTAAVWVA